MRFAFLLAALCLVPDVAAQMLPSGTWTGTWAVGRRAIPASAEIERCDTGFRVVLTADGQTARTETATWRGGQLRFTTSRARMPGMLVARVLTCRLASADDGLAGLCVAGRSEYRVTLSPPAGGAFGCD